MGYVAGTLRPVEVCKTEMVWVPADEGPAPDPFYTDPPGPRAAFGDHEFMGLLPPSLTGSPGFSVPPPSSVPYAPPSEIPLPPAGLLFLGVVVIVLLTMRKRLFQ